MFQRQMQNADKKARSHVTLAFLSICVNVTFYSKLNILSMLTQGQMQNWLGIIRAFHKLSTTP